MFSHWLGILHRVPENSQWATNSLRYMAKLAKTFDEWRIIFYFAPRGSEMEEQALQQMGRHSTTFGQWLDVWSNAVPDSALRAQAEVKLIALADKPTDVRDAKKWDALIAHRWQRLLEIAPLHSSLEDSAQAAFMKAARNVKIKAMRV